jgi:hypothetical protein
LVRKGHGHISLGKGSEERIGLQAATSCNRIKVETFARTQIMHILGHIIIFTAIGS